LHKTLCNDTNQSACTNGVILADKKTFQQQDPAESEGERSTRKEVKKSKT